MNIGAEPLMCCSHAASVFHIWKLWFRFAIPLPLTLHGAIVEPPKHAIKDGDREGCILRNGRELAVKVHSVDNEGGLRFGPQQGDYLVKALFTFSWKGV